jgi:hypothetical protein
MVKCFCTQNSQLTLGYVWQVGDNDAKLAEGIRILAIPIPAAAKRAILTDLITVCADLIWILCADWTLILLGS